MNSCSGPASVLSGDISRARAYAMKVLGQVYDYLKGRPLSVDLVDNYVGFHPAEVVDAWFDIDNRIPMYVWDDAGYWLFSLQWHDPLLIAVQRYMNVIGTDMNCARAEVRERDKYRCRMCGEPGKQVHHVDYDEGNNDPSNLVTLCRFCHPKTNHDRDWWQLYFTPLDIGEES